MTKSWIHLICNWGNACTCKNNHWIILLCIFESKESFFDLCTLNWDENCENGWQFEDEIGTHSNMLCNTAYKRYLGNKSTLFSTVVYIWIGIGDDGKFKLWEYKVESDVGSKIIFI